MSPRGSNGHRQLKLAETGPTWSDASDIERLAYELVDAEEITLGHLRSHTLAFEFRRGGNQTDEIQIDKISGAIVAPPRWAHRIPVSGVIWVYEWWWNKFPDHHGPVILHQLLHLTTSAGALKRDPLHTVADFDVVARRYGAWSDGMKLIYRQLELFEQQAAAQ